MKKHRSKEKRRQTMMKRQDRLTALFGIALIALEIGIAIFAVANYGV